MKRGQVTPAQVPAVKMPPGEMHAPATSWVQVMSALQQAPVAGQVTPPQVVPNPWKTFPAPSAVQPLCPIGAHVPSDLQQAPWQLNVPQLVPAAWAVPPLAVHAAGTRFEQVPVPVQQATVAGQVTPPQVDPKPW